MPVWAPFRPLSDYRWSREMQRSNQLLQHWSVLLIESLDEYWAYDWDTLKARILDLYDAEREETRYQKGDLDHLVRKYSKKPLTSLADWK